MTWRLEEDAPQLLTMCREKEIPVEDIVDLPVKRLRERAAERLLLYHAFAHPAALLHDGQGAPLVDGEDVNISITHTPRLVAVAIDERRVIGIDAEQADRQQVLRVRDKFLNAAEQQFIAPDDQAAHVIAWTAKEAIIKAERNSALDWTDGITLEPFVPQADEIALQARCGESRYQLISRAVEGHYITVASQSGGLVQ